MKINYLSHKETLERNKEYLLRKQNELGLTDSQMIEWVKGKRDFN